MNDDNVMTNKAIFVVLPVVAVTRASAYGQSEEKILEIIAISCLILIVVCAACAHAFRIWQRRRALTRMVKLGRQEVGMTSISRHNFLDENLLIIGGDDYVEEF